MMLPAASPRAPGPAAFAGIAALAALAGLVALGPGGASALPSFDDATAAAGLDFLHAGDPTTEAVYVEMMGGGACWLDYDLDGWHDLFLVNGRYHNATPQSALDPRSQLYRNNGDGTFTDRSAAAGLDLSAWGMGCAAGDYDNDRDPDLVVTAYGYQYLFRNEGDGTFANASAEANITRTHCGGTPCFSNSAAFLDYDLDGDLDLYVLNYLAWDLAEAGPANPNFYPAQCNILWRNEGDGTFTDVTEASGTGDCDGNSLAVATGDYDGDGWADIFVASDETPDDMYRNRGDGTFEEVGQAILVNDVRGGMGADLADINGDGRLDLAITHFEEERYALYRSNPGGTYEDIAKTHGLASTFHNVGWGTGFLDLDNDGLLDLLFANGHVSHNYSTPENYDQRNGAFRGLANGTFEDVTGQLGEGWAIRKSSRGMAVADYDRDGFLDVVFVNNPNQTADLLRSRRDAGNFLALRLEGNGTGVNTDAFGARVTVEAGGRASLHEVRQGSYLSQSAPDVHIGLGRAAQADRVSIRWPSDPPSWTNLTDVPANQVLRVRQGHQPEVLRAMPVAGAPPRAQVEAGRQLLLAGSVLRAPSPAAALSWAWGDGATGDGAEASHAYAAPGVYTARFRVTAEDGAWDEATVEVRVVVELPVADAGPDRTADRVAPVVLDGSASRDGNGEVVNHTWDLGDGRSAHGAVVSHRYEALGPHRAVLTVRDDEGGEASDEVVVTVVNLPPAADPGPHREARLGTTFAFDGSGSSDPDGTVASWAWDFGDGATAEGPMVEHRYAAVGIYTVRLTVTDLEGGQGAAGARVAVLATNAPPVAHAGPDREADRVASVAFDAAGSSDPDGAVVAWAWDFGDGATAGGPRVEHRYASLGTFSVRLTVTDDEGAQAEDTAVVRVRNLPPVPQPGPPRAQEGLAPVAFDGAASRDPDGSVASWAWDFGDGATGGGAAAVHAYASHGRREVRLTVTDDDGASASATTSLWLYARPVARMEGEAERVANRVEPQAFDGSASTDADGRVVDWAWDFGDGATARGPRVEHRYARLGTFAATLTVTDDDGWTGVARATVTVVNLPPVAAISAHALANLHQDIALDGTASHDPDGTLEQRGWWLGDGAAEGAYVVHAWAATGTVRVTHTVTDNDGASATASWDLDVVDWLQARVRMAQDEWTPLERPRGTVEVRYANGLPVRGAEVRVAVAYMVRDPLATGALAGAQAWRAEVQGTTRSDGTLDFEAPSAQRALLGAEAGPALAAPTVGHAVPFGAHAGSYDVAAAAAWRGNAGADATRYHVRLLMTQDVG